MIYEERHILEIREISVVDLIFLLKSVDSIHFISLINCDKHKRKDVSSIDNLKRNKNRLVLEEWYFFIIEPLCERVECLIESMDVFQMWKRHSSGRFRTRNAENWYTAVAH